MDPHPLDILVVCQWSILTAGLERALAAAWPEAAIVAVDGALGALGAASATRFDLAVIQQDLAGVSGVVTSHVIHAVSPGTVSVLLVEHITDIVTMTAIGHGVAAIVPTASTGPRLVGVARQALAGARPLDTVLLERPDLAATMFDDVRSAALDGSIHPLGLRAWPPVELAIFDGLIRGMPEAVIATHLAGAGGLVAPDVARSIDRLSRTAPVVPEPLLAMSAA